MFEFVREILKVAGGEVPRGAKEAERETKVACWYVVGEVMKELGANVSRSAPLASLPLLARFV